MDGLESFFKQWIPFPTQEDEKKTEQRAEVNEVREEQQSPRRGEHDSPNAADEHTAPAADDERTRDLVMADEEGKTTEQWEKRIDEDGNTVRGFITITWFLGVRCKSSQCHKERCRHDHSCNACVTQLYVRAILVLFDHWTWARGLYSSSHASVHASHHKSMSAIVNQATAASRFNPVQQCRNLTAMAWICTPGLLQRGYEGSVVSASQRNSAGKRISTVCRQATMGTCERQEDWKDILFSQACIFM
jgi:hypothetical protein